jgi:mannose-6-phosphate isomerase-like protein (cupin superfamily)
MTFHKNIIELVKENEYFRQVVHTGAHAQVVLMSIAPGEDIGMETHAAVDQTLVFVQGEGKAIIAGEEYPIEAGTLSFVEAGTEHNFINTGSEPLKLYTVYAPANHPSDRVHKTKADALADEEHGY